MMWWHDGMGWGDWVVMTLTMAAFWALVVFALIAIFRSGREARSDHEPGPERILDERFARGEIDVDEYHARQDVLRASQRSTASQRGGHRDRTRATRTSAYRS
jgi:putative membrane protein